MKFSYHPSMCPPQQYAALACAAQELGFDTFTLPDSICYPQKARSKYPYNEDGSRDFLEGVPFIEPLLLTAYLAGITTGLRFTTSVLKLAIRQPVIVAKQLSSLAVISGNRFGFGVGISPWREDFEIAQIPWQGRGKRMDETIDILRGLLSGNYFEFHGEIFDIPPVKLCPVPSQPVPILIGGHSDAALKRAALRGDGWIAAGADYPELKNMIQRIQQLRRQYHRDHLPFEIHAVSADAYSADGIERLRDIGVDEVLIAFRDVYRREPDDKTVAEKIDQMRKYAESVILPGNA